MFPEKEKQQRAGPPPKYGTKSIVRSLRVPMDLWDSFGEIAAATETTRNEMLVEAMQQKVKTAGEKSVV